MVTLTIDHRELPSIGGVCLAKEKTLAEMIPQRFESFLGLLGD